MRIIGIDPGTVICGYGVIEVTGQRRDIKYISAGDIKLNKKEPLQNRLKTLHDSLKAVILEYRPTHLCLEKIFYHKSIRSALALGSTRGIALYLAAEHLLPVFEYNPTELKMALTGYGRAEKSQVQQMVKRILNIPESGSPRLGVDSTDALALCVCHVNMGQRTGTEGQRD